MQKLFEVDPISWKYEETSCILYSWEQINQLTLNGHSNEFIKELIELRPPFGF